MSVTLDILRSPPTDQVATPFVVDEPVSEVPSTTWDPETFAREQIRSLVRQVFLPEGPRPARQVVFCGVDATTDVAEVCALVGKDLAAQISGRVCLVEANPRSPALQLSMSGPDLEESPCLVDSSGRGPKCISDNLWLMSAKEFLGRNQQNQSTLHLRLVLTDIRRDFEYAIIHAAPASLCSEPALLGHLTDGVVLVLEANFTRRIAARKVIQNLQTMNAKLLGAVLNQRTFPIPERLYRRL
jgi:polysaccharide biosynthesis transport protein